MARRRGTTTSDEWEDEDAGFKKYALCEEEDRKTGQFPHDTVQRIPDFYRGKDVFITGATGFVGKVLIEKMLRSLPEGGRLFLLLRAKKGLSFQERVQKMLSLALFKELMTETPQCVERLVPVKGDSEAIGLGLSQEDRQMLIENVSIVIHAAATVRFDVPLTEIILNNTRGTREIAYLCREMKKLEVFVHVSTSFCNATHGKSGILLPEKVLPQDMDWRLAITMAEKSERDTKPFDLLFKKIAPTHIVNYAFSKGLAECMLEDEFQDLPIIIVRPTVVIATYEDPFPGWVDNLYGPMSIWDGVGQGIIRTQWGVEDNKLDYVPVDMTVKTLIVAGWHRGLGFRLSSDPKRIDVVNSGTGDVVRNMHATLHEKMQILFRRHSHRYVFRYPRIVVTNCYPVYWFIVLTSHVPLGVLIDTVLRLRGRKPILLAVYRKLHNVTVHLLHHFQNEPFSFDCSANWLTQARIRKEDRDIFCLATKAVTMDFYHDNVRGIIEYTFNEKAYSEDQNNRRIMYVVDWIQNVFLFAVGFWIIYSLFSWKMSTITPIG